MSWISVKDKMPIFATLVVTRGTFQGKTVHTFAYWKDDVWTFLYAPQTLRLNIHPEVLGLAYDDLCHIKVLFDKDITHWMPIPEIENDPK